MPLGQIDEWTAKPSPFLIQGRLSGFVQIMATETLKNPYLLYYRRWRSNFTRRERKLKYVLIVFQRIFSSWALAPTHFTIFIRGLSIILFSFINKVFPFKTFLVSKGLLCLYDKQNNTWLPISIKFIFSCSNRHLTCLRRSLLSYRVKHSKRNSISVYAHVLFSIYQLSQGPRGKFLSGAP